MRPVLFRAAVGVTVVVAPALAVAGVSLSPIMQSWNHNKHAISAMLSGGRPYDEAQIRQDLQHYETTSSALAHDIKGNTAEARDFASRFKAFANDSETALAKVNQPSAMKANFNRMVDDCQSCHAVYNN